MLEYSIIFIAVGWAIWFTGRNLWREVRQGQCGNCYCKEKKNPSITQIQLISPDKNQTK